MALWNKCYTNSDYRAIEGVFADPEDWTEYGIGGGPPPSCDTNNNVQVPEVNFEPTEQHQLQEHINPLYDDGNHGINLYVAAILVLEPES